MQSLSGLGRSLIWAGLPLILLSLAAAPTGAQGLPETKDFENTQFRYAVALPAGCRHEEGPGTIDAVCSLDFDPERSAIASNAGALVLAVGAEVVEADAGKTLSELRQRYGEAGFKEELPEAICGESDKARVQINNFKEVLEEARVVYTADVVCAEVKFLQLRERRAAVRYLIAPDVRYRLVARAPTEEFEKQRGTIDAFFASFRLLPAGK
jgi:hypothetical protein